MGKDSSEIWFEIRPINWACNPDVDFSLDALKTYVSLMGIGSLQSTDVAADVTLRHYSHEHIARRVFADDSPKAEVARYLNARKILESHGLVESDESGTMAIMTANGLPYRASVKKGYKNERTLIGSFMRLKAGMFIDNRGSRSSRLATLTPEELLLLLILFQGSRWVFGGVHQEYVSKSSAGKIVFGTLVKDMWANAMTADQGHGCVEEKKTEAVLESLISKQHFAWGKVLLDSVRNAGGFSVSSQRVVVLTNDPRHPSHSREPERAPAKLVDVLIPCYGYPMSRYQPDLVKMIQRGQLSFEGLDYASAQIFGVTRWA